MRSIGHPDFQYTPWSAERRAAASKAARARIKAAKSSAEAKKKKTAPETKPIDDCASALGGRFRACHGMAMLPGNEWQQPHPRAAFGGS
jgi:hypothetical protein